MIKYILLFCFTVFISCNGNIKELQVVEKQKEIELPGIRLMNLEGAPVNMEQYKGKTVFINFWATWCKPCLDEMPSIQIAINKLKKENIVFLLVSDETAEQIEQFKSNHNYNFNYLRTESMEELNITGLPTTMIFNASGKQVFSEMGFKKWDNEESINLLLEIINTK